MPTYNTYDDYVNGSQVDINETSKNAMYERGKYLVEYIDKIPNKLTGSDFKGLLSDEDEHKRIVCTYGPGSGKTTALRQYVCNQIINNSISTGVISILLKSDVMKFVYDVRSQLTYQESVKKCDYIRAYTGDQKFSLSELRAIHWVVCTHQRLLIEPSSILYYSKAGESIVDGFPRESLIIDEMPSNMFISGDFTELASLANLDTQLVADNNARETELPLTDGQRSWLIYNMVREKSRNMSGLILQKSIPHPFSRSYYGLTSQRVRKFDHLVELDTARLSEFTNYFTDKFVDYLNSTTPSERTLNDKIYYTPLEFKISKVLILDGTGDLLFENSGWDIVTDERFSRKLNINQVSLVESRVSRYQDVNTIVKAYTDILTQISNKYETGTKILGYLWKTKKDKVYEDFDTYDSSTKQETEIIKLLKDELNKNNVNNVELITYKSGKEKSSNEFIESSVAVILGKFVLPDHYIEDFSNANKIVPKLESLRFTETLLIQFMYRTQARLDKPIDLYIDNQYSDILEDLLKRVNIDLSSKAGDQIYCNVPELQPKKSGPNGPNSMTPEEIVQRESIMALDKNNLHTVSELKELIGLNSKAERLYEKLDKFGIPYEKIGKGRGLKINLL